MFGNARSRSRKAFAKKLQGGRLTLLLLAALVAVAAAGPAPAQADPPGPASGWTSVLQEEFTLKGRNVPLWTNGWPMAMNNNCANSSLVDQPGDGFVHFFVKEAPMTCFNGQENRYNKYTGAVLSANPADGVSGHQGFEYRYGYVEWKAFVPAASGSKCPLGQCVANWPAFWSIDHYSPGSGQLDEFDVAEGLNGTNSSGEEIRGIFCTHWHHFVGETTHPQWGNCDFTRSGGSWHTFALDWEPSGLSYYYDGQLVFSVPASTSGFIPTARQFPIVFYMPPENGRSPLVPNAEMKVDWVKVWQHPKPPTVSAVTVSDVTDTSARLTGTVNPEGLDYGGVGTKRLDGRYRFECGRAGSGYTYLSSAEGTYVSGGSGSNKVAWTITGLEPGASYNCRLEGDNAGGVSYSANQTFSSLTLRSSIAPGAPAALRLSDGNIDVFTRLLGVGDQLDFTRATSGSWSVANLTPAGQPKMGAAPTVYQMKNGAMHAFAINTAGDIVCYYRSPGESWHYINLSAYAGATLKFDPTTTPSVVEWATDRLGVYARAANGDLVSLERNTDGSWFMWNESAVTSGHPTIVGSPSAVVLSNPSAYSEVDLVVFARNSSNQLVSFNRLTSGTWVPYNVSANTGVTIAASPTAVQLDPATFAGSGLGVYAPNATGELISFDRMTSGGWLTYNVTKNIPGGPAVTGSVAPIRLEPSSNGGSVLGVYARTTGNDLVGFSRLTSGAWTFYNVSASNGYPKISSPPAVLSLAPSLYAGSGLQVHARSTNNELLSFDRMTNGNWLFYNETQNVTGKPLVE
jgi:hypothetical protein